MSLDLNSDKCESIDDINKQIADLDKKKKDFWSNYMDTSRRITDLESKKKKLLLKKYDKIYRIQCVPNKNHEIQCVGAFTSYELAKKSIPEADLPHECGNYCRYDCDEGNIEVLWKYNIIVQDSLSLESEELMDNIDQPSTYYDFP